MYWVHALSLISYVKRSHVCFKCIKTYDVVVDIYSICPDGVQIAKLTALDLDTHSGRASSCPFKRIVKVRIVGFYDEFIDNCNKQRNGSQWDNHLKSKNMKEGRLLLTLTGLPWGYKPDQTTLLWIQHSTVVTADPRLFALWIAISRANGISCQRRAIPSFPVKYYWTIIVIIEWMRM